MYMYNLLGHMTYGQGPLQLPIIVVSDNAPSIAGFFESALNNPTHRAKIVEAGEPRYRTQKAAEVIDLS
jgi:hypothetical protein